MGIEDQCLGQFLVKVDLTHLFLAPKYVAARLIQFPPEMDKNWLRYELLNLGQIYETKLAEDVVLCVHNTTSALNR